MAEVTVYSRDKMLKSLANIEKNQNSELSLNSITSELAVGSASGYEVLLPKYEISTGRDGSSESVSQARIYLDKKDKWFRKDNEDLIPGVNPEGQAYVGFLLSSVTENKQEKVQTLPLNGDNYVATFFGESPTIYSFGGILYNTHYARWREIFSILYSKAFRGSAIAKHRQLLHLVYDNKLVSGWMLNLSQSLSAATDTMSNFQFQLLVRTETILGEAEDLAYNNAYFTGKKVDPGLVDELADLPNSDDYLNTARMRPPPKRQRGIGTKRYQCRPGRATILRNGRNKSTNPKQKGQNLRNGTPTASSCDVTQALLNILKEKDGKVKRAKAAFNRKWKGKEKQKGYKEAQKTLTDKVTRIRESYRKELTTSYNDLKNPNSIKDERARTRARLTNEALSVYTNLSSVSTVDQFVSTLADSDTQRIRSKIKSNTDKEMVEIYKGYFTYVDPKTAKEGS